ncbi:MAG: hypothetical protein IJW33_03715 [Lentisphaeria bacterium]|nr:hypothetical protein [Lentisphaeria bacterium]
MGMHNLALFSGNAALALKEKEINEYGPVYVRLVGRKSGLIDWILTLIGVNTTTVFEVYESRIEYSYGSLSGRMKEMIPMSSISNMVCGYFKPVLLLVAAVLTFIIGIIGAVIAGESFIFIIDLVVTAILLISYFLKKSTLVSVFPSSSLGVTVIFKRSVIENQTISAEEAQRICDIVTALVNKANS